MANIKSTPLQALSIFKEKNPHLSEVRLTDTAPNSKLYTIEVTGKCEHYRLASLLGKCYGVVTSGDGTPQKTTSIMLELD